MPNECSGERSDPFVKSRGGKVVLVRNYQSEPGRSWSGISSRNGPGDVLSLKQPAGERNQLSR